MGRGGKVVCKRSAGRPKKKNHREEDEDDESYVAEEEGSSFESDGSNGESFDASEVNTSASSAAEEEEIPNAKPKSRRGYYSGRRRSKLSDYEDLEDEDYEDDEDFSPDASDNEDLEEDSLALVEIRGFARAGATKQGGRKFKRKASNPKVNRRSSKVASEPVRRKRMRVQASSDDEDNFIAKGRTVVKQCRKDSKKRFHQSKISSHCFQRDFF